MADDDLVQDEQKEQEQEVKVDEFKDKYLRALADYQNLEKQTQIWKTSYASYATLGIVQKLLEVLDDLEKAQTHIKDDGLQIVVNKLKNILKSEGVVDLELQGMEYDPNVAEVVSTVPGDKENIVVEVLHKGYKVGDKVVRPAKVVVSTVS